jgi:hypothetical protein
VADVADGYAEYYAQRLWALLPAVHRTDDTDASGAPGPLRELLNRIGGQVAVVRRSIDRLWADQSIETCDDWVIPYIGGLLGTNLVNGLDARGQRLDVAKTIHYRRRKGTLAVLEELARDVTGWDAHVVEGFRRLARTRHGLDPMVGPAAFPGSSPADVAGLLQHEGLTGPLTGTPAGGLADLRSAHGAALSGSPFDEGFHTADLRAGRGAVGHFGIQKLLVFLWRLTSFPVVGGTPVQVTGCPGLFTFDPTGRQVPIFLPPAPDPDTFADTWTSAYEWQVPGPITRSLEQAMASQPTSPPAPPYPFPPPNPDPPPATLLPFGYAVHGADLAGAWPETGRFTLQAPDAGGAITVDYQYGFAGTAGAGPYDRLLLGNPPPPVGTPAPVSGGTGLDTALRDVTPQGTVTIADSRTYGQLADVGSTAPITAVLVAAGPQLRPVLRPAAGSLPAGAWTFTGDGQAELTLDGLLVSGCDIVLRGSFDTVRLTACTMDPGTAAPGTPAPPPAGSPLGTAADGQPLGPTTIWIGANPGDPAGTSGSIRQLLIDHCILGPIRTRFGGSVETIQVCDSIIQGIPTTTGPEYGTADVYDPALLASGLLAPDPLSAALFGALPVAAQAAVKAYVPPAAVPQAVIDGLNALVMGPSLYDPGLFATVALSPDVQAQAGGPPPPPGTDRQNLNRNLLDEVFPVALGLAALAAGAGTAVLNRVTVLGRLAIPRLQASDSILTGYASVSDTQDGCVRFTACLPGSRIPRQYRSVAIGARASLFTSTDYGDPGYGQLIEAADRAIVTVPAGAPGAAAGTVPASISTGAETGSELGAFSSGLAPIKEQGLLIKCAEYMPLGLTPVIVHVT